MSTSPTIQKFPESVVSGRSTAFASSVIRRFETRIVSFSLLVALLLPLVGMHMLGVQRFRWLELSVVPWDFAIVLSALVMSLLVVTGRVKVPDRLPITFYLMGALLLWFAVEATQSPVLLRGWTMVLLLIRDLVLFGAVFLAVQNRLDLPQFSLWVSVVGIMFTAVSIPVFLLNINNYGERFPFDGIYVLFELATPRFIGFVGDPNFFGLTASISLMTIPFATKIPLPLRWLAAALLMTAIFFTGSRMLPVSVVFGTGIFIVVMLFIRQQDTVRKLLLTLAPGLLIAMLIMPVWFLEHGETASLGSRLYDRYALGTRTPRTELWAQTIDGFTGESASSSTSFGTSSPFVKLMVGNGLRSNQSLLNGSYSHNTYLDLLGETGIVGLLVWLAITAVVSIQGFTAVRRKPQLAPWLIVWLTTLGIFAGFSLLFAPYYWFIAAVISGVAFRGKADERAGASPVQEGTVTAEQQGRLAA